MRAKAEVFGSEDPSQRGMGKWICFNLRRCCLYLKVYICICLWILDKKQNLFIKLFYLNMMCRGLVATHHHCSYLPTTVEKIKRTYNYYTEPTRRLMI